MRYLEGALDSPPPFPDHYFSDEAEQLVLHYLQQAKRDHSNAESLAGLLEEKLQPMLDNTWGDTAKALVNNWLGLVYKLTNLDRHQQFMEGVDPHDPLAMNQ